MPGTPYHFLPYKELLSWIPLHLYIISMQTWNTNLSTSFQDSRRFTECFHGLSTFNVCMWEPDVWQAYPLPASDVPDVCAHLLSLFMHGAGRWGVACMHDCTPGQGTCYVIYFIVSNTRCTVRDTCVNETQLHYLDKYVSAFELCRSGLFSYFLLLSMEDKTQFLSSEVHWVTLWHRERWKGIGAMPAGTSKEEREQWQN